MEEPTQSEGKYAGLSKGQIKKLKEKEKKEREAAAAAAAGGDAKVEANLEESKGDGAAPAKGGKAKKGKKGKGGGMSEAMKAKLAEQQRIAMEEKELLAKMEREEDERIKRLEQEDEEKKRAADAIAEEKKRAKLDEKNRLKAEGKWLSKKDLIKKKAAEARLK